MVAISKEPLEYVLSKYNIDVIKIRNESYKEKKGVWWVHTLDGFKVLKKISNRKNYNCGVDFWKILRNK